MKLQDWGIIAAVVGLPTLFVYLWITAPTSPADKEFAARKQAEKATAQECLGRAKIAADAYLASVKMPADKFCAEELREFVHAGKRAACAGDPMFAMVEPCAHLKKLRQYCPPKDWPSDAHDPATLNACRM